MMRSIRRARGGWTLLELVVVLVCLATFLTIAAMAYQRHQDTVYKRICFQQQRTLQGQIESLPSADLDVPVDQLMAQLVAGQLLPGTLAGPNSVSDVKLMDPGQGDPTWSNYMLMPGSKMIGCKVHGSVFDE